jgi:hypothetical protein
MLRSVRLLLLFFATHIAGSAAVAATKVSFPYTPNSYVDEVKRSGFLAELWK